MPQEGAWLVWSEKGYQLLITRSEITDAELNSVALQEVHNVKQFAAAEVALCILFTRYRIVV